MVPGPKITLWPSAVVRLSQSPARPSNERWSGCDCQFTCGPSMRIEIGSRAASACARPRSGGEPRSATSLSM
jgi:hypothetical protein